jgi:hypothetical protein
LPGVVFVTRSDLGRQQILVQRSKSRDFGVSWKGETGGMTVAAASFRSIAICMQSPVDD